VEATAVKQGFGPETQEHPGRSLYVREPDPGLSDVVAMEIEIERLGNALVNLLWLRRKVLWQFLKWGFVASVTIAVAIPNWYSSTAHLMPPEKDSSLTALAAMAGASTGGAGGGGLVSLASDVLGMKTSGELYLGVLQSRVVADNLINRFDLRKVYWRKRYEDARKKLESRTDFLQDHKSGILTISVSDRDPARAVAITNAYIEELNNALARINTSAARREREFLEERLQSAKAELTRTSREFSDFASKNLALNIPEQSKASVYAAAELQGQLIAAETQLNGLEAMYTANNIRVRSARASVDELRRQISTMGGVDDSASAGLGSLNYPSIRQLPKLGLTYAELYRNSKIAEVVYETLVKQYEVARLQEAKDVAVVRVLDTPSVPERKAGPQRTLIIVCLTLGSLLLGCIWIVTENWWNQLGEHDLRRRVIAHALASIPQRVRNGAQKRT
jgi:capsule polysaccharide export protein KpsE/RkpR